MSMLTAQCARLRKAAKAYEDVAPYTAALMRDAADTIADLRLRLTKRETCHDTGDERVFCCSGCGFGLKDVYLSDEDYLYDDYGERIEPWPQFCPNCGRRVVK